MYGSPNVMKRVRTHVKIGVLNGEVWRIVLCILFCNPRVWKPTGEPKKYERVSIRKVN